MPCPGSLAKFMWAKEGLSAGVYSRRALQRAELAEAAIPQPKAAVSAHCGCPARDRSSGLRSGCHVPGGDTRVKVDAPEWPGCCERGPVGRRCGSFASCSLQFCDNIPTSSEGQRCFLREARLELICHQVKAGAYVLCGEPADLQNLI